MSFGKSWTGDWHGRILERVHQHGFETVTQYASARPGVSLLVLAKELGPDDVAAVQIRSILVEEASRTHTVPRALRDLFVRELRESLPGGRKYPLDDASRYEVAGALATWKTELKVEDPPRLLRRRDDIQGRPGSHERRTANRVAARRTR